MKSIIRRQFIGTSITFLIFCATAIGLWRFGLVMEAKRNRVITVKQQLASYDINRKIFQEESESFKSITARLVKLESYRITPEGTPELLSTLESLAQANGVEFSITPVQTPTNGSGKKLLIDFSAHGGTVAIEQFLNALDHQVFQVRFNRFSLYASADTTSTIAASTLSEGQKVKPTPVGPQWDVLAGIEIISF